MLKKKIKAEILKHLKFSVLSIAIITFVAMPTISSEAFDNPYIQNLRITKINNSYDVQVDTKRVHWVNMYFYKVKFEKATKTKKQRYTQLVTDKDPNHWLYLHSFAHNYRKLKSWHTPTWTESTDAFNNLDEKIYLLVRCVGLEWRPISINEEYIIKKWCIRKTNTGEIKVFNTDGGTFIGPNIDD